MGNVLTHDSLELIDLYLREQRVFESTRGSMLIDLYCQEDPDKALQMVEAWTSASTDEEWDTILDPYKDYPWQGQNCLWDGEDLQNDRTRRKGRLDDFIWRLRRADIPCGPRRAMLRDRMSQQQHITKENTTSSTRQSSMQLK